jgi:hypothetical protein
MCLKIEYAVAAARVFITHLHRENLDRGMIATFGNTYRVEQHFTSTEAKLHAALSRLSPAEIRFFDGSSRFYDSIEDTISEFRGSGTRNRPWLLIIITDGANILRNSKHSSVSIGRYIAQYFNYEPSNFIFAIGLGRDLDIKSLNTISYYGGFQATTIDNFALLEKVFLQLAFNMYNLLIERKIETENLSWQEVVRIQKLSQAPIDYAFLIDRSGSMAFSR